MGTIIRGTTPTLTFNINSTLDLTEVAEVWVTFKTKASANVKEKTYTIEDVDIDAENNKITLVMTQEDTLSFSESSLQVQIRLRMEDDMAYASEIIETSIGRILKDGVI